MHNHITESCAVVGGDMRIAKAAGLLAESGFEVKVFGLDNGIELGSAIKRASNLEEAVVESRFVLLPIPLSQDSLTITAPPVLPAGLLTRALFRRQPRPAPAGRHGDPHPGREGPGKRPEAD